MLLADIYDYYRDADELPELPDAPLTELTCFECCNLFASDSAEPFCSMACESRWCRRALCAAQLPPATEATEAGEIPF